MAVLIVLPTRAETDAWCARFAELLPGHAVVSADRMIDPDTIDYAVAWAPPPGIFAGCRNLKAIFALSVGVDHIIRDSTLPTVPVVRVVDDSITQRMCEYVMLHCLAHLRQARRYADLQRDKVWVQDEVQPSATEVRVGLMGLGVLGKEVGRRLAAMGFQLAGWARTPRIIEGWDVFAGPEQLDAFLARSDILVAMLPLTPATRGILNRALFSKLPHGGVIGPVLINVGRGALQIEGDLVEALDNGTLTAATLDVFEEEPLPPASPLWTHPRVTVTPHNAALASPSVMARAIASQINAHAAGASLQHKASTAQGY